MQLVPKRLGGSVHCHGIVTAPFKRYDGQVLEFGRGAEAPKRSIKSEITEEDAA
jgi:hypothetical protein